MVTSRPAYRRLNHYLQATRLNRQMATVLLLLLLLLLRHRFFRCST
jgi:hypothetical protein